MPLPDNATIAGNVRAEMARRNLRQDWLCTVIGVAQSQASKRLQGKIGFTATELAAVAAELRMPVDAFTSLAGSAA